MVLKLNLGKPDSKNEGFITLNIKSLLLIVPAIVLGHYVDTFVDKLNINSKWISIITQTLLNIFVIFVLYRISQQYTREFQVGLAGLFFSALFFGMQTNYIKNLKAVLSY